MLNSGANENRTLSLMEEASSRALSWEKEFPKVVSEDVEEFRTAEILWAKRTEAFCREFGNLARELMMVRSESRWRFFESEAESTCLLPKSSIRIWRLPA